MSYGFLVGPGIRLVDSAEVMAAITAQLLAEQKMANTDHAVPAYQFYVTDVPLRFRHIGEHFLGRTMPNVQVVKL